MNKKRVLIFSLAYFPKFVGGAEVAIKEITDRLGDQYDFDLITTHFDSKDPKTECIGQVNIHRVGWPTHATKISSLSFKNNLSKIFFPFLAYIHARNLQKKNGYDIVWSMMANQAGFAGLFFKNKFPKAKFLLTLQEGDPIHKIKRKAFCVYPLFKNIFKKADYIQTISSFLSTFAFSMNKNVQIEVVPNGVDLSNFSNFDTKEPSRTFNIFSASRLVEKNGLEDLILALSFLPDEYMLEIAGDGPLKDHLHRVVKKHNLENRVTMHGYVNYKELNILYRKADVFIRPSLSEGLGNVFLEAMASRVPVIATDVGGISDIVKDKKTGLIVKTHNPRDIADKVVMLKDDHVLRENIVFCAYNMVLESYDWNIISRRMGAIFKKIV